MSEPIIPGLHDRSKRSPMPSKPQCRPRKMGCVQCPRGRGPGSFRSRGACSPRSLTRLCYAVSYGLVFPSVVIAQSIPHNNAIVSMGLIDGAHAGQGHGGGTQDQDGYQPDDDLASLRQAWCDLSSLSATLCGRQFA